MNQYDDIINLPHHVSTTRPQMSRQARAAQFSPFAALTGYDDAITEKGRRTAERHELNELEQTELNKRFNFLVNRLKSKPEVDIVHFVPDERKSGGEYQSVIGTIKSISLPERFITLDGGQVIHLNDILEITGKIFSEMSEQP